jgi:hypothetical protein
MSRKKLAHNDAHIAALLKDKNYLVLWSGEVMTRIDRGGHVQAEWRSCLVKHHSSKSATHASYFRVQYKRKHLQAHRIIYAKFLGELRDDLCINHKDGDGLNNCVENLELVTMSANNAHRYQVLKQAAVIGHSKITQKIADKIRADHVAGKSYRLLCAKYGMSKGNISAIINGKIWKAS